MGLGGGGAEGGLGGLTDIVHEMYKCFIVNKYILFFYSCVIIIFCILLSDDIPKMCLYSHSQPTPTVYPPPQGIYLIYPITHGSRLMPLPML